MDKITNFDETTELETANSKDVQRQLFEDLLINDEKPDLEVTEDFFKSKNFPEIRSWFYKGYPSSKNISPKTEKNLNNPTYLLIREAFNHQNMFENLVLADMKKVHNVDAKVDIYTFYQQAMNHGNNQIIDKFKKLKKYGKKLLMDAENQGTSCVLSLEQMGQNYKKLLENDGLLSDVDLSAERNKGTKTEFTNDCRQSEYADMFALAIFAEIRQKVGKNVKGYLSALTRAEREESRGKNVRAPMVNKSVKEMPVRDVPSQAFDQPLSLQISQKIKENTTLK